MSVGHHLGGFLLEARLEQARRGLGRFTGVEDVEVPAPAPERDDLPAHRLDQVHVVRLKVPQYQRHDPVPSQARGHAADQRGLAQARLAKHECAGVADEFGALKPRDRVAAQRRAGVNVASERYPDHRGSRADRERPQPTHLHRGTAPLLGCLHVGRSATTTPQPPPHGRTQRTDLLRLLRWSNLRGLAVTDFPGLLRRIHSLLLSSLGIFTCLVRTSPSGSAAANAESCDP